MAAGLAVRESGSIPGELPCGGMTLLVKARIADRCSEQVVEE